MSQVVSSFSIITITVSDQILLSSSTVTTFQDISKTPFTNLE
ncbi:MAG: hypothetical protein WCG25_05355 [bacterium]